MAENQVQRWNIYINEDILLWIPDSLKESGKWSQMLARMLVQINRNWLNSHVYIRLNTYTDDTKELERVLGQYQYRKICVSNKNENVFIIPDCSDEHILEAIFETGVVIDCGRSFFILSYLPVDWVGTVSQLFNISQNLSQDHKVSEYQKELSGCLCLCYSVDENLVIGKVDLSRDRILSITRDIARDEGLRLIIHQEVRK